MQSSDLASYFEDMELCWQLQVGMKTAKKKVMKRTNSLHASRDKLNSKSLDIKFSEKQA